MPGLQTVEYICRRTKDSEQAIRDIGGERTSGGAGADASGDRDAQCTAHDDRDRRTGQSAWPVSYTHLGTDTGPIILQKAVEVLEGDTPEVLQRRVMEQAEWVILPRAIDLIANGRVTVSQGKVHIQAESTAAQKSMDGCEKRTEEEK